ncbi:phage tail assembly protein [Gellertiella hungarica]|uniref:Tail assembly chaperone E/41/14-like protein n=1 Tax=Gellertiella hungarica TaxID=1572859 RepID=A0A7W6J7M3_9HYPH|nr:phage tail assembly protein [Gellertiella hungarica]MBB4066284.1 hypothetical protein [Gellertiella hungarica]
MTSNRPQTAVIATPQSKDDPFDVKIEEIPMPPADKWEELDNSTPTKSTLADVTPKENDTAAGARPIAKLNFIKSMASEVPLAFPFEHPEFGEIHAIVVHRLTVGQVGDILDARAKGAPDLFDIYAAMTGLTPEVLRGLEASDGERVTGACFDFLPPLLRPAQTG